MGAADIVPLNKHANTAGTLNHQKRISSRILEKTPSREFLAADPIDIDVGRNYRPRRLKADGPAATNQNNPNESFFTVSGQNCQLRFRAVGPVEHTPIRQFLAANFATRPHICY